MSTLGTALTAGGIGLSTLSSLLGAQSANRAGRQARDFSDLRTGASQIALGRAFFGPGYARFLDESYDPMLALQRGQDPMKEKYSGLPTGGIYGQMDELARTSAERDKARLGAFDQTTRGLEAGATSRQAMAQAMYGNLGSLAGTWGSGAEKMVGEDADRQEKALNARSVAALTSRGFGNSTAVANTLAGNSATVGREKQRALNDIRTARVDRQLAAGKSAADYSASTAAADTGRAYGRATTREALESDFNARDLTLRSRPWETTLALLQGGTFNPYLNQNTIGFYPGASGAAAAGSELGGGLAAIGGQMTAAANQQAQIQALLAALRPESGGGGTVLQ